jgi:broad specificity phosphatase PhoE
VTSPKRLELRRHAATVARERRGLGSELSAEGVRAARAVGERLDRPEWVVASPVSRTTETAIAMGFAVDEVVPFDPIDVGVGFHDWLGWEHPFATFAARRRDDPAVAHWCDEQLAWVTARLDRLAGGEGLLVVGHGGWLEPILVAAVAAEPAEHRAWGGPFGNLEGATLGYDDGRFALHAIHRRS